MKRRLFAGFCLAAMAGAAPAQPPSPATAPAREIVPVSPDARLGSTRGKLRLDGACASVTLATLAASPACAARVGRGESGPILEVVMATRSAAPPDR